MKKYLIKLVKEDLSKQINARDSAAKILQRMPNDEFWLRRLQSQNGKIKKAKDRLSKLEAMNFKKESDEKR